MGKAQLRRATYALAAAFALLACAPQLVAWGRKVNLERKYRAGQSIVYQSRMETRAQIKTSPEGLENFLPPAPTRLVMSEQNTVTVRAVRPDGGVDIENRFDAFEIQAVLPDRVPADVRESAEQAQEEFSRRVRGQAITVHYDREGRLLGFEGADEVLQQLDVPVREVVRQVLRLLLEQMSGNALYPGHRVKPGEEWKRKLAAPATDQYPFSMEGESTLRYSGKTKYRGVKAAIVDFSFTNLLTPQLETLRKAGPLGQLEAMGMGLDIRIDGQGKGRMVLALDDGRILQNHATVDQKLSARLKAPPNVPLPSADPITLEISSETVLKMDGSGKKGR